MMQTTTTPALSAGGASATLAITSPAINLGTAALPVYVAPAIPDPSKPAAVLTASPDFIGAFTLSRVASVGGPAGSPQVVVRGDNTLLSVSGAGPIANLAGTDSLTLTLTACASGTLTLSAVQ